MSISRPKVLFVAHDAGGFRAIYPVYKRLKARGVRVRGLFSDVSKSLSVDVKDRFVDATRVKASDIVRLLDAFSPDVVITGTGYGLGIDKLAIRAARRRTIPTIAIVDFWSDYLLRFSTLGTADLAYLPDTICVMDPICKQEMVALGFEAARIVITGNPYFESFRRRTGTCAAGIITFFCQPFSEFMAVDPTYDRGYTEQEVFTDIVRALEKIETDREIIVKLHPRTVNIHKFDAVIAASSLHIRIDRATQSRRLIARSAMILGMNSTALFEAALAGKKVLSYQPNAIMPDQLISNRLGLSVAVYRKRKLASALKELLRSKPSKATSTAVWYVRGRATENVIQVLMNRIRERL